MKLRDIILSAVAIFGLHACYDEGALEPNPSTNGITYEFPEGNDSWDQDLQEIADRFDVKCIYKNLTIDDLTRSWTAGASSIRGYYGSGLINDRQARLYTKFFKDNVFAFLNPDVVRSTLPAYFFFAHDYCSINTYTLSTGETWEYNGRPTVSYNGLGFWVFSYSSEVHNNAMPTMPTWQQFMFTGADSVKMMREMVLKNIFNLLIEDDIIDTPVAFEVGGELGFDYSTALVSSESDENYYKRRGFPDQFDNLSTWQTPRALNRIQDTDPTNNFFDYIKLGLRYSREEVLAEYADYPLIIRAYDHVVNYLNTNYGMDLALMGAAAEPLE